MAKYKFYRINVSDFRRGGGIANFVCIDEVYLYDAEGNDVSRNDGCIYTASTSYNSDNGPANAFNRIVMSLWHSATNGCVQWICVEFPEAIEVKSFGITPRNDGWTDYINSFTFEGSNDGQTWDVLLEEIDIYSGWVQGTERVFELPEPSIKNYNTIEEIVAGVENATQLVNTTKYDDNSYTIDGVPAFVKYKGASVSTMYANGNSYVGFGADAEHFKYNRRDAAMYNLWMEEATYLDAHSFFRIRWGGMGNYNSYGDPYKQTFDLLIFDTGDVMLYAVDIPTSYYNGTFSFDGMNYNAPTTDSRYVTFYAQADGTYRIEYAPISFVSIVTKYLVRDGSTIYTVADGALAEVTGELSASLFTEYGVDTIPDGALLMTLATPEVLCWTNAYTVPKLTATVTATPQSQVIITDKIYLTDKSITGIESALATCEGELIVAVSFDDKQTWKAWNGKQWATLSDDNTGMSKETLEGITFEQWNELYTGATGFYVRISLTDTTQAVEKIVFDFAN